MNLHKILRPLLILHLCFFNCQVQSFEPITVITATAAVTSVVGALFASWYYYDVEPCTKEWNPHNMTGLQKSLKTEVFGQHIATDIIFQQLAAHLSNPEPVKPLVMSFHGWTGGGKNWVASLIANSFYKKGMQSQHVHHFMATVDFPHPKFSAEYSDQLRNWIKGNVSSCPHSLFIFDEVDKMPPGVFDGIKSYLDYNAVVHGVDFRKAIFIILSNKGGTEITHKMLEAWNNGAKREDLHYKDFEKLIQLGAFNEEGGLHKSSIIDRHLIDLYVPFLPLERPHLRSCARREFKRQGYDPSDKDLDAVVDSVEYGPSRKPNSSVVEIYSIAGCKKIAATVGRYVTDEVHGKHFD